VDVDGNAHRLMHAGVRYSESDRSQPPTILPAGTVHSDGIEMADGAQFVSSGMFSTQLSAPFVKCGYDRKECKSRYVGRVIKLLLTVGYSTGTAEYLTEVKIEDSKREGGSK